MTPVRLEPHHKQLLAELYERTHRTSHDLPYTDDFERLYASFLHRTGLNLSRHQVWRQIANQRKASGLTSKRRSTGRADSAPDDENRVDCAACES